MYVPFHEQRKQKLGSSFYFRPPLLQHDQLLIAAFKSILSHLELFLRAPVARVGLDHGQQVTIRIF